MKERIENELARITKEREAYLAQANQQMAAYDGAIAALKQLLKPEEPDEKVDYHNDPMTTRKQ